MTITPIKFAHNTRIAFSGNSAEQVKFGFAPITLPSQQTPQPYIEKPYEPKVITMYHGKGIQLPDYFLLDGIGVSEIAESLHLQDSLKQGSKGNIKLMLNFVAPYGWMPQTALADTMKLISTPVDIVIQKATSPETNFVLQSASGHRFITPNSSIQVGPNIRLDFNRSGFRDSQVRRRFINDYLKGYEEIILSRTGSSNRKKVHDDITSETNLNPLEALAYGSKGLVDAILLDHNRVVTRQDLNTFYAAHRMTPKQIEIFNHDIENLSKVPSSSVQKSFPDFLPEKPGKAYEAPKPFIERFLGVGGDDDENGNEAKPPLIGLMGLAHNNKPAPPVSLISDSGRMTKFPNFLNVFGYQIDPHMQLKNTGIIPRSILHNDVISLSGSINPYTSAMLNQAVIKLADKRLQGRTDQNIKMLINSPGGLVANGLWDVMKTVTTPIDVIVNGSAYSMAAGFTICTSGKRFATLNSTIMIHEHNGATGIKVGDGLNRAKDEEVRMYKELCSKMAKATGRPLEEVIKDTSRDFFVNPLEAILYGSKGMIDAILVGPDEIITRADVEAYLTRYYGSKQKLFAELEKHFLRKREPLDLVEKWKPEDHNEQDPLENPLRTINAIAATNKKKIASVAGFEKSGSSTSQSVDFLNIPHVNIDQILEQLDNSKISALEKNTLQQQLNQMTKQQGLQQLPRNLMG